MQRGTGNMQLRLVGGDDSAERSEEVAVAAGTVPDADASGREAHVLRLNGCRAGHEDLATAGVDHRVGAADGGRERVQGRNAGHGKVEREREAPCDGEADARAGEAPGP